MSAWTDAVAALGAIVQGWWRQGEASGSTMADSSGNTRNGTYADLPTLGQTGLIAGDSTTSASYAASADYSSVPYGSWMNTTNLTLIAWLKSPNGSGTRLLITRDDNVSNRVFQMLVIGGKLYFERRSPTVTLQDTTINLADGATHMVAAVHDGTQIRLNVDGVDVAQVADANLLATPGGGALTIGGNNVSGNLGGPLQEVLYISDARTEAQLADMYAAGIGAGGGGALINGGLLLPRLQTGGQLVTEAFIQGPVSLPRLTVGGGFQADIVSYISGGLTLRRLTMGGALSTEALIGGPLSLARLGVGGGLIGMPGETSANPIDISGEEGEVTFDVTSSSMDAGETAPPGVTRTEWVRFTAPDDFTDSIRFRLTGAIGLRVYEADGTTQLFTGSGDPVNAVISVESGVEYLLQIGGDDTTDSALLVWMDAAPPEHDAFADALELVGTYGSEEIELTNATIEAGEPAADGVTAWATFTATLSTDMTFDFSSSGTGSYVVRLYRGTTLGGLTLIDSVTGTEDLTMESPVDAGQQYYLRFDAVDDLVTFEFSWQIGDQTVAPASHVDYLRVEVYEPDGVTLITELPRRRGVQWQEPLNVAGSGSIQVALPDTLLTAYPTLFNWRNIVKFWLGDVCVHGFRIRKRRTTYVSEGEWSGYVREVSGPSVQHMLNDMIVQHDGKRHSKSTETRHYGWASMRGDWYNESDWDNPVNAWDWLNPPGDYDKAAKDRAKYKMPKRWPDPGAKWMWMGTNPSRNVGGFTPKKPYGGKRWYRKNFYVSTEGLLVRLYAAADESYRVYLDGEEVLGQDNTETGYTDAQRVKLRLHRGSHTIAVSAHSIGTAHGADGNDSVILTMMRINSRGKPTTSVIHSDANWEAYYGPNPPGWHRAHVLRNCVIEARARGVHSADRLTLDFTGDTDTAGRPWIDRWNEDVTIGTTGLELQATLSEGNGFDVWVDPEDLSLKAWRRRGTNRAASVTLEPGRNATQWAVEETDESVNAFLVHFDGGWTEYVHKGSVKNYDRREVFVALGNTKRKENARRLMRKVAQGISSAAKRAGTGDIRVRKQDAPEGGIIAVPGARPFLDFGVGDTVKCPNEHGVLTPHRVIALSGTEDENGNLSYDPDVEEIR